MIIMAAGGRDYADRDRVREVLRDYAAPQNILIHGGATGADSVAHRVWTQELQSAAVAVPARWSVLGKRAGFVRTNAILSGKAVEGIGRPDLVVAFPGGRGTQYTINRALKLGIEVEVIHK